MKKNYPRNMIDSVSNTPTKKQQNSLKTTEKSIFN